MNQTGRNYGKAFWTSFNQRKNYTNLNEDSMIDRLTNSRICSEKNASLKPFITVKKTKLDFLKLMIDLMKKEIDKTSKIKKEKHKNKQKGILKRYRVSLPFPLRNSRTPFYNK